MIKWIITDLDGTLLGFNPKENGIFVDPKTIATLNNKLKTKQYKFTIATGRHYTNVKSMMNAYELQVPQDAFIVGMNGAQVYSVKEDKLIRNVYIENERIPEFNKVIEYFEKNFKDKYFVIGYQDEEHNMFFYDSKSEFFTENMAEMRRYEDKGNALNPIVIQNLNEVKNIYKIIFSINPPYDYEAILANMTKLLPNVNIARSSERFIEVFPSTVNKAVAIDYINKHYYKLKKDEMIAFGDSFNDFEMLEYTGTSVTKTSAHAEIQAICDYVIDAGSSTFVGDAIELLLK